MKNIPLREQVTKATGIRTTLENDANAAAWGEFWAGAGKGVQDLVMFTLGTGVGGGVISEGRLLRGYFENGGELGHILVNPGGRRCSCKPAGVPGGVLVWRTSWPAGPRSSSPRVVPAASRPTSIAARC